MKTLVVYDIPNDAVRLKVAECCLDYGLDRIQYSAFLGDLNRNLQEELFLKVEALLGDRPGKVHLFSICDKDWRQRFELVQEEE